VNLLGDNLDTIKKNMDTLINASKEVGLVINIEKTKYMLTILNEGTTFRNKLWVFSLLFYFCTALHVSAYKQAIFRCFLTNHIQRSSF
jgi:hypothetical protein